MLYRLAVLLLMTAAPHRIHGMMTQGESIKPSDAVLQPDAVPADSALEALKKKELSVPSAAAAQPDEMVELSERKSRRKVSQAELDDLIQKVKNAQGKDAEAKVNAMFAAMEKEEKQNPKKRITHKKFSELTGEEAQVANKMRAEIQTKMSNRKDKSTLERFQYLLDLPDPDIPKQGDVLLEWRAGRNDQIGALNLDKTFDGNTDGSGNTHLFQFLQGIEVLRAVKPTSDALKFFTDPQCMYWSAFGLWLMDTPDYEDGGSGRHFINSWKTKWDGSSASCRSYQYLDYGYWNNVFGSYGPCAGEDAETDANLFEAILLKKWWSWILRHCDGNDEFDCQRRETCIVAGQVLHYITDHTMPNHASGFSHFSFPFGIHTSIEQVAPLVQPTAKCTPGSPNYNEHQCRMIYNYLNDQLPVDEVTASAMTFGQLVRSVSAATNHFNRHKFFAAWIGTSSECFSVLCMSDCQRNCLAREPLKSTMEEVMRNGAGATAWALDAVYNIIVRLRDHRYAGLELLHDEFKG